MNENKGIHRFLFAILGAMLSLFSACENNDQLPAEVLKREASLNPDIYDITVPVNIAPLNFDIREDASVFYIDVRSASGYTYKVKSHDGRIRFPMRIWRKLLENSYGGKLGIIIRSGSKNGSTLQFDTAYINVADSADRYLCYRLLYPGYETYYDIKILQRDIATFTERSVVENRLINHNCINCHSFSNNNPGKFLVHARGNSGGTFFIDGKEITRVDFRSDSLSSGTVYPSWRKDGKFVVFSSNNIRQSFHARHDLNIEVTDLSSLLVLYDVQQKTISPIRDSDTASYMDTFPEWSPDGRYIYFCRAKQYRDGDDPVSIHYNLMRRPFSETTKSFGPAELIFDAEGIGKSVSFPRISPDGKLLVFTLHDYGNFSIWHKEADLYLMEIAGKRTVRMSLNSDQAESWHGWSSNGKWLVFSSKRDDGLTARPYFSYIESLEHQGKPFALPQKDPGAYGRMLFTFNRPEFITGRIEPGPRDFAAAAGKDAIKPNWKSIK